MGPNDEVQVLGYGPPFGEKLPEGSRSEKWVWAHNDGLIGIVLLGWIGLKDAKAHEWLKMIDSKRSKVDGCYDTYRNHLENLRSVLNKDGEEVRPWKSSLKKRGRPSGGGRPSGWSFWRIVLIPVRVVLVLLDYVGLRSLK